MKVYITTKSALDGPTEDVIRFQRDEYAGEDYAILTLAGFTKVLELAQGWAFENLETVFVNDIDALLTDYYRDHKPSQLDILNDDTAKKEIRDKYKIWSGDNDG